MAGAARGHRHGQLTPCPIDETSNYGVEVAFTPKELRVANELHGSGQLCILLKAQLGHRRAEAQRLRRQEWRPLTELLAYRH